MVAKSRLSSSMGDTWIQTRDETRDSHLISYFFSRRIGLPPITGLSLQIVQHLLPESKRWCVPKVTSGKKWRSDVSRSTNRYRRRGASCDAARQRSAIHLGE